jgi:chitodextrinase
MFVASNITATTASLSWDAVTGAVSYEIYNGTTLVAATTSSSFTINNLIANTDYNFTVLALDADDNTSQQVLMFPNFKQQYSSSCWICIYK